MPYVRGQKCHDVTRCDRKIVLGTAGSADGQIGKFQNTSRPNQLEERTKIQEVCMQCPREKVDRVPLQPDGSFWNTTRFTSNRRNRNWMSCTKKNCWIRPFSLMKALKWNITTRAAGQGWGHGFYNARNGLTTSWKKPNPSDGQCLRCPFSGPGFHFR
jgi:hypothetical protein